MSIVLARVDERLIHGQIVNEWVIRIHPTHIIIVDGEMVKDVFMSNIYKALAPLHLNVEIFSPADAAEFLTHDSEHKQVFLLARTPLPFEELKRLGVPLEEVILADKAYFPNKITIPASSKHAIRWLLDHGVRVIVQNYPSEAPQPVPQYKL